MVCWPLLVNVYIARIIATAYQLANKDQPLEFNTVTKITNAAVIACMSLALIGAVYTWYVALMLPAQENYLALPKTIYRPVPSSTQYV